eukprot:7388164-Prymnesium_polylepis.4
MERGRLGSVRTIRKCTSASTTLTAAHVAAAKKLRPALVASRSRREPRSANRMWQPNSVLTNQVALFHTIGKPEKAERQHGERPRRGSRPFYRHVAYHAGQQGHVIHGREPQRLARDEERTAAAARRWRLPRDLQDESGDDEEDGDDEPSHIVLRADLVQPPLLVLRQRHVGSGSSLARGTPGGAEVIRRDQLLVVVEEDDQCQDGSEALDGGDNQPPGAGADEAALLSGHGDPRSPS